MTTIDVRFPRPPKKTKVPLYPMAGKIAGFAASGSLQEFAGMIAGILLAPTEKIMMADSASNALYTQLQLLQSSAGQSLKVALPSYNCTSVIDAVLSAGCEPVLIDIGQDMQPTAAAVSFMIEQKCALFIWPSFFGTRLRDAVVLEKLKKHGIKIIFDEAQSFPFSYETIKEQVDTYAYALLASFGRSKPLAGIGGGLLYVPGGEIAQHSHQSFTWFGLLPVNAKYLASTLIQKVRWSFPGIAASLFPLRKKTYRALDVQLEQQPLLHYTRHVPMHALQAALAVHNYKKIQKVSAAHSESYNQFLEVLAKRPGAFTTYLQNVSGFPAIVALCVEPSKRHRTMEWLTSRGIQVRWYYLPLHRISRYASYKKQPDLNPEPLSGSILIVPFGWAHTRRQKTAMYKAAEAMS